MWWTTQRINRNRHKTTGKTDWQISSNTRVNHNSRDVVQFKPQRRTKLSTCSTQFYEADRDAITTSPASPADATCLPISAPVLVTRAWALCFASALSHLASTRKRRTLSWHQHQSGTLQSIEFKGLVLRPPRLVAKSMRTDVWRANYVERSLIARPRRCRRYWCSPGGSCT